MLELYVLCLDNLFPFLKQLWLSITLILQNSFTISLICGVDTAIKSFPRLTIILCEVILLPINLWENILQCPTKYCIRVYLTINSSVRWWYVPMLFSNVALPDRFYTHIICKVILLYSYLLWFPWMLLNFITFAAFLWWACVKWFRMSILLIITSRHSSTCSLCKWTASDTLTALCIKSFLNKLLSDESSMISKV